MVSRILKRGLPRLISDSRRTARVTPIEIRNAKHRVIDLYYSLRRHPGSVYSGFRRYDRPLLVSYSRSGTNWVRYIVESLSGLPTPGATRVVAGDDYVIDRAHRGFSVLDRYGKVMLLIRDYRECLLRHLPDAWRYSASVVEFLESRTAAQPPAWYIRNLAAFDRFDGEKTLVYYEDLIRHPETQIPAIVAFFELPDSGISEFLDDLAAHRLRSLEAYGSNQVSVTAGVPEALSHHADTILDEAQRSEFDDYYRQRYPHLWSEYLSRYKTRLK